mgnify:CR=1 FL=1|tara:strand:- start:4334 stop:5299 length:966 start_codon:yes stop_codon:yes gene_type:complete
MSDNKNNEEINLDEQYKSIVESEENSSNSSSESPVELGKVDMSRFQPEEAREADFHLGYHVINKETLPSSGMFYLADAEISIRSAKVAEIRHFSTMDETNILDVDDKLNAILESCTRITSKTKRLSYKDLLEEDRFFIILSIRDLTFPEAEQALTVKYQDKKGASHTASIEKKYFKYFTIPEELDKYYDVQKRTFLIETKSFGTIEMKPPSIGLMQKVTKYIKEKQEQGQLADQSLIQLIPYLHSDWRSFNEKTIFNFEVEMNGWNNRRYALVYKLAEKMKVGIQPEMVIPHEDEEVFVPIGFRDGIKSIFIVQDIAGELL